MSAAADRSARDAPIRHLLTHRRSGDSVLRLPLVRRLFIAQVFSLTGTAGALLATAYVAYQHSSSVVHSAIVATAFGVPAVFLGPAAGRLADSRDHRHVVVTTFAAQMSVWVGLAVLDIAGLVNPWWLTLSSLLSGAAGALQFPSLQELERQLAPDDRLHEVNGAFSSAGAIASVLGAAGGGVLLTLTSPAVVFAFNTVSYLPLMVVILRLPIRPPASIGGHPRAALRDALSFAWSQHRMRVAIRLGVVLTLLAAPIAALLPAIADELGSEAHVLGLLTAFYSLGGSLVAVVLTIVSRRIERSRLIRPAVVSCATSLLLIGLLGATLGPPGRQIAIVAMLVPIGLGLAMAQAVISAFVQLSATWQLQSQVLALYAAASSVLAPVGAIALATISEARSVWLAVALAGGLLDTIAIVSRILIGPIPQELQGADHRTTLAHAAHHGRFARGPLDPRRLSPLTVPAAGTQHDE